MITTLLFTATDFFLAAACILSGCFLFGFFVMPFFVKGILEEEEQEEQFPSDDKDRHSLN